MLGEKFAELVNFIREDKALSDHSVMPDGQPTVSALTEE